MTHGSPEARHEAADLVGQLARELSALVRRDIEVAGAERLPTLRRALLDASAVAIVAAAGFFAFAAAAWTIIGLAVAIVLVRPRAQPTEREELFGLLQMLSRDHRLDELQSSREHARDEAEQQMRQTSSALVKTLLDEAAEHQLKALPQLARREAERAEADAADVIADAVSVLIAPARAGWKALERLVEPQPQARKDRQRPTHAGGARQP
ncbi:MAG: hypothetical protein E6G50_04510 [Actinobacteria bacterium]|nr:MAG: hypothetical protein E6G50_04510 [Actinomycetota bacterium]